MLKKKSIINIAAIFITLISCIFIMVWAKQVFMPLAFGILFTFLLHPLCSFFEKYMSTTLSIISIFLILTTLIGGLLFFFVDQFISIFSGLKVIFEDIKRIYNTTLKWFAEQTDMTASESQNFIQDKLMNVANQPLKMVGQGLLQSTMVLTNMIFAGIYTFFFLLYRRAFKNYIISRFKINVQNEVKQVISQIQKMVYQYLFGLSIVILIIAVVNMGGLYAIGVKNAIFWAIFSAILVIIPYIGSFLGAVLPFFHSLITADYWWQPLAVACLFIIVQFVEGNFITPKIVGSSVKVNPLAAIVSVLLGGMIWGIAGAILAIPYLALVRIILTHIDGFKDIGHLLDSNIYKKQDVFFNQKNTPSEEKHSD